MAKQTTNIWERAANAVEGWLPEATEKIAAIVRGGDLPPFHRRLSTQDQLERFFQPTPADLARLSDRSPEEKVEYFQHMQRLLARFIGAQNGNADQAPID